LFFGEFFCLAVKGNFALIALPEFLIAIFSNPRYGVEALLGIVAVQDDLTPAGFVWFPLVAEPGKAAHGRQRHPPVFFAFQNTQTPRIGFTVFLVKPEQVPHVPWVVVVFFLKFIFHRIQTLVYDFFRFLNAGPVGVKTYLTVLMGVADFCKIHNVLMPTGQLFAEG
jgi:hypothetical protein